MKISTYKNRYINALTILDEIDVTLKNYYEFIDNKHKNKVLKESINLEVVNRVLRMGL